MDAGAPTELAGLRRRADAELFPMIKALARQDIDRTPAQEQSLNCLRSLVNLIEAHISHEETEIQRCKEEFQKHFSHLRSAA